MPIRSYPGGRNRWVQFSSGFILLLFGSLLALGGIGAFLDGRAGEGATLLSFGLLTLGGFAWATAKSWRTRSQHPVGGRSGRARSGYGNGPGDGAVDRSAPPVAIAFTGWILCAAVLAIGWAYGEGATGPGATASDVQVIFVSTLVFAAVPALGLSAIVYGIRWQFDRTPPPHE